MSTKAKKIIGARLRQLRRFVPELFGPGTLLYVGASTRRAHYLSELMAAGRMVTILEAYAPNVAYHRKKLGHDRVIHGDIRNLCELVTGRYGVAFWWHGPEHISKRELPSILVALESRADLVVLGCPWGLYPQGAVDGNPYERHVSALTPEDFRGWGYETWQLGKVNGRVRSNLLAVKRWIS